MRLNLGIALLQLEDRAGSEVKIYYGAGDMVEAMATVHVEDLLALCEPVE